MVKSELMLKNISYEDRVKSDNDAFGCYKDECVYTIYPANLVKESWMKWFGTSSPVNKEVMQFDTIGYYYDETGRVYVRIGGYENVSGVKNSLVSAKQESDKIILNVAAKFYYPNDDLTATYYYSDVERTKEVGENDNIPANYRFIFQKGTNGNYHFYQVEKIK